MDGILRNDPDTIAEVVEPLSVEPERVASVAERLRTGRLAELYFREHYEKIAGVLAADLLDHRELFRGYDFAVKTKTDIAIEVKGIKQRRGGILFTSREWEEAIARRKDYWLVVVGDVEASPTARLIPDPTATLEAKCQRQMALTISWRATITIA